MTLEQKKARVYDLSIEGQAIQREIESLNREIAQENETELSTPDTPQQVEEPKVEEEKKEEEVVEKVEVKEEEEKKEE